MIALSILSASIIVSKFTRWAQNEQVYERARLREARGDSLARGQRV